MLENAAESHPSSARFVRRFLLSKTRWLKKALRQHNSIFAQKLIFGKNQKHVLQNVN